MRPPPPPQALSPEHSTSTKPSSAAKRAFTSRTALSTKGHEAPPERKKRKTPPPESTPAKASDATEPSSKKKLVLFGRACRPDDEARVPETLAAPCCAGGGEQSSKGAAQVKNAGHQSINDALGHKAKTLDEMRELYPHLVDESMALLDPAVLERVLPRIDDNEAQALDKKIKRARRQLTKAIRESAMMKNMETSVVFLCEATRLQMEKPRMDKQDGLDICAQERLARVEREIVELRQIVIDSHYQATIQSNLLHDNSSLKGVRCKSEESHPQLAVAENQIPHKILQKKIDVPNGFPHEKNEEVTSKYKYDGVVPPRNPHDNLKLQGLIKPPFNTFHGRTRKVDAESQTGPNMDGKEVVLHSIVWPHTPVGKAILQSSSPSTIVGGVRIGTECCKVFLSEVLKSDAPLFRQNGEMKMFDALKCSIAWPNTLVQR
ncbi:uncharacterized LOC100193670 [Zea mays]|nr:uncharacterized LOC100193670 [Zea mays]ACF81005.1 unknown [Zea mays]|eukprot:NP_001132235.1 uncharacterized LOC100193670 [Zea mays]